MTLKWTWENNQYYSLLANPCGFILIELMSNHLSAVPEEDMIQSHTRMTWRKYNTNIIPGHHITPIRVSRAISRPELVDLFWIDILNSEEIYSVIKNNLQIKIYSLAALTFLSEKHIILANL